MKDNYIGSYLALIGTVIPWGGAVEIYEGFTGGMGGGRPELDIKVWVPAGSIDAASLRKIACSVAVTFGKIGADVKLPIPYQNQDDDGNFYWRNTLEGAARIKELTFLHTLYKETRAEVKIIGEDLVEIKGFVPNLHFHGGKSDDLATLALICKQQPVVWLEGIELSKLYFKFTLQIN